MNVRINRWAIIHNHLFRQYFLLFKACYMFRLFHKAIDSDRLKNIGENKHIILFLKRGLNLILTGVHICLFYILAETELSCLP